MKNNTDISGYRAQRILKTRYESNKKLLRGWNSHLKLTLSCQASFNYLRVHSFNGTENELTCSMNTTCGCLLSSVKSNGSHPTLWSGTKSSHSLLKHHIKSKKRTCWFSERKPVALRCPSSRPWVRLKFSSAAPGRCGLPASLSRTHRSSSSVHNCHVNTHLACDGGSSFPGCKLPHLIWAIPEGAAAADTPARGEAGNTGQGLGCDACAP